MTQYATVLTGVLAATEAVILLHAAAHDVAARTIPDRGCLALAVLGVAQRVWRHQGLAGIAAGGLAFVACMVLWRRGWMGGGDAKLLGACACLVPPADVPAMLGAIMISGGLLGCGYLVAMRFAARGAPRFAPAPAGLLRRVARLELWRLRRRAALPYGVAISAGTLMHVLGA